MEAGDISRRGVLAGAALLPAAAPVAEAAMSSASDVRPFRIDVPQAKLDRIWSRLREAEWPDQPAGRPWTYGTSVAAMRDLVAYWTGQYDWRAREAMMNRFPHYLTKVEGHDVHFLHVQGSGKRPRPILLSHGWPGSFVEFLKVIEPLAHPERFGGNPDDAFSVVVPSLIGTGFSAKPAKPVAPVMMARLFDQVMVERLGYRDYIAQGGDLGAPLSVSLGQFGRGCKAVHLNFLMQFDETAPPLTEEDNQNPQPSRPPEAGADHHPWPWPDRERGYQVIQGSKPLTLAYLADSPIAVAAWIFEKFKAWSWLKDGDPWSVYTRDEVLDNIMVYLVTGTFGTSTWMYCARYGEDERYVLPNVPMRKPLGIAHYVGQPVLPRSYVERNYQLIHWADIPDGGHFAAYEKPDLFVQNLRDFNRRLRALG